MGISGGVAEGDGIVVQITAAIQGLLSGMKESAESVNAGTKEMEGAFEGLGTVISAALAPLLLFTAAIEGLHIFHEAIENTTELAVTLEVLHQKTGIATETLSAMKYAAELSHVSFDQLGIALQRLARNMEQAARGGAGPATQAFKDLGIAVADSNGKLRPMEDVLLAVADRFHGMDDGAKKTALAIDIFGRSGANLIPMLNQGRDGIQRLEEEARRLGVTLTEDNVEAINEYHHAVLQLKNAWGGLVISLTTLVMPVLDGFARFLTAIIDILKALGDTIKMVGNFLVGDFKSSVENAHGVLERLKDSWTAISTVGEAAPGAGGLGADIPTHMKATISLMQQLEHELDVLRNNQKGQQELSARDEADFWFSKLKLAKAGSAEALDIYKKYTEAYQRSLNMDVQLAVNDLKIQGVANKDNLALQVQLAESELLIVRNRFGELSKEYASAKLRLAEAQANLTKDTEKTWQKVFDGISGSFTKTIDQLRQTGGTFRDFMRGVFQNIAMAFADSQVKILEAHAASWLAQKGITAQGVLETVALNAWGAIKVVAMKAAEAAAGAWAAISGIPYVGPFLAPAAAAAALAGVLALAGSIHSAAGGFDVPAGLNPITQLHAQEMVLPKQYANVIRGLAGGQGARGDTHLHVHTVDAAGVRQFMMKHRDAVASAAHSAADNGLGFREQPGRRG
jgi:hypothetical protein